MAGIFTGLGTGLGAAALGSEVGQNKGEAEFYRRQQLEQVNELRKLALAAKKRDLDPNKPTRDLYGRIAADLVKMRSSPEMAGFYNDPANIAVADQTEEAIRHAIGVSQGTIPIEQANPSLLAWHPIHPAGETGAGPSGATAGLTDQGAPAGAPAGPFTVNLGGGRTATPPEIPELSPGISLGSPGGGTFIPSAPGTPRTAPSTPATPATPLFETPKQRASRLTNEARIRGLTSTEDWRAANKPLVTARTEGQVGKNERAGAESKSKIGLQGAQTAAAREAAATSAAMRPIKVTLGQKQAENIGSEMKRRADQTTNDMRRMTETEKHNRATETVARFNADTNRARQVDMATYHRSLQQKIKFGLDHWRELELGKDDRATLNYAGRILSAQVSMDGLKTSAAVGQKGDALQKAEDVFSRFGQRRGEAAPPAPEVKGSASIQTTGTVRLGQGSANPATPRVGSITPEQEAHIREVLKFPGEFGKQLSQVKRTRGQSGVDLMLRAYKQVTGKDYRVR